MILDIKDVRRALETAEKDSASIVSIYVTPNLGMDRLYVEYVDLNSNTVTIQLSPHDSGGFNKIIRTDRF